MRKDEPSRMPASCSVCVHRWYGIDHAHCTSCHRTFGDTALFDQHRPDQRCANPVSLGMIRHGKTDIWLPRPNGTAVAQPARTRQPRGAGTTSSPGTPRKAVSSSPQRTSAGKRTG